MPEDYDIVRAWLAYKEALCPGGCGQPFSESMHPDNEDAYDAEARKCHACNAHALARQGDNGGYASPPYLFVLTQTPQN